MRTWSPEFHSPAGFTADGNTPRPHLPHLPRIHTQQPTSAASLLPTDFVRTALEHQAYPSPIPQLDSALGRTHGLDGTDRVLRRVYAPGWATTGACGVLAATMTDAYAAADAILADHFGDGSGTVVVPVQHGTHTEDVRAFEGVDLERVPREVERSVKDKRVGKGYCRMTG
ncbi:hypothetical protein BC826DRAFT_1044243 [Russula brevipes]|nr:hypothetical protein BC826DRAFT_1044243 [Russula brevipes]